MMIPYLTERYGQQLQSMGPCFTAFAGTTVIGCAGVLQYWTGRGQVWSLLSDQLPRYRKGIHAAVKTFLLTAPWRRLEWVLDPEFVRAVDWAKRLGFSYESTMPAYGPNGELQDLYVRIRQGD